MASYIRMSTTDPNVFPNEQLESRLAKLRARVENPRAVRDLEVLRMMLEETRELEAEQARRAQ